MAWLAKPPPTHSGKSFVSRSLSLVFVAALHKDPRVRSPGRCDLGSLHRTCLADSFHGRTLEFQPVSSDRNPGAWNACARSSANRNSLHRHNSEQTAGQSLLTPTSRTSPLQVSSPQGAFRSPKHPESPFTSRPFPGVHSLRSIGFGPGGPSNLDRSSSVRDRNAIAQELERLHQRATSSKACQVQMQPGWSIPGGSRFPAASDRWRMVFHNDCDPNSI